MYSGFAGRAVVVKLGDFATARALDSSNPVASSAGSRLTLAPEVEDYGWVAWHGVLYMAFVMVVYGTRSGGLGDSGVEDGGCCKWSYHGLAPGALFTLG